MQELSDDVEVIGARSSNNVRQRSVYLHPDLAATRMSVGTRGEKRASSDGNAEEAGTEARRSKKWGLTSSDMFSV